MRKSKAITLILLTSSLFVGCDGQEKVRNQYASWDDCVKDYRDSSKCDAERTTTTSGSRVAYYGPWYNQSSYKNPTANPSTVTRRAIGVSRGGFGASGAHVSS